MERGSPSSLCNAPANMAEVYQTESQIALAESMSLDLADRPSTIRTFARFVAGTHVSTLRLSSVSAVVARGLGADSPGNGRSR